MDAYDPCPCGSGKKFKWCCQPVHVEITKAFKQHSEGQHEAALRIMDAVCTEHSGNPEAWGRKAELLFELDRGPEADSALEKAFAINPRYPFGLYLKGRFRHFEGEIAGALLLFRQAAQAYDPNALGILSHLYALITDCELKLNRPVAARAALELAVKGEPANEEFRKGLDQAFGKEARLPEAAKKDYKLFGPPADAPNERRGAWQVAMQAADIGKLADAAAAFEQLTGAGADDSTAWFNLGLTKAKLGDNAGAVTALERSIQLDKDENRAAESWALAEVLLCGHGLEEQANFVESSLIFPITNPELCGRLLQELQRQRRLIGIQMREQEGIMTGVLVDKPPALTAQHALSQPARLAAYLLVIGNMFRLWNVNRDALHSAASDLRQLGGGALGEPMERKGPAHFEDVLADGLAFPLQCPDEATAKRQMKEYFERYLEETWVHKPLRVLGQSPPAEAARHAAMRKKLLGHILFLQDCARAIGNDYDFDRLRRKLGLLGMPAATTTGPDIQAMSEAEIANIAAETLNEDQLEMAYQTAIKLSAQELAAKFAKTIVTRPTRPDKPDRYPHFNHLIQMALSNGDSDAALEFVDEGEKSDCEHNEGRRRNDYELRRGQVHVKRNDIAQAMETFERLIERAPAELKYRGSAAEAMLAAKQGAQALQFAEGGLKKSREQNNRDSEQYFMELSAAAKKLGT
jgi:tetratricopeptide (TPR) repeat protein